MAYYLIPSPNNKVVILTARLSLRLCHPADAIALHTSFSHPEVMRYWSEPPHVDVARTQEWVETMTTSPLNGVTDFVITLRQNPANTEEKGRYDVLPPTQEELTAASSNDTTTTSKLAIGKIGVFSVATPEIGFMLSKEYWHQGLASEALFAVLGYLFTYRDFQYVIADADPRNDASIGLLKKHAGFVEENFVEKTLFVGVEGKGEWVDSLYLRLEKDVWDERKRRMGFRGDLGAERKEQDRTVAEIS